MEKHLILPTRYEELCNEIKDLSVDGMIRRLKEYQLQEKETGLSEVEQRRKIMLTRCIELCLERFIDLGNIFPTAEKNSRPASCSESLNDPIVKTINSILNSKDYFAACKKSEFYLSKKHLN